MASAMKIADNGLNVVRHVTVRHHQISADVFEEKPARSAAGTGQPRTTGIEGTDTAHETVGSEVSVAADHYVGAGSGQQWPELLIGYAWFDSRAVVGLGGRVDAQDGTAAREQQAQLRRETDQDIEQAAWSRTPRVQPIPAAMAA
jgi:hypothetical protein